MKRATIFLLVMVLLCAAFNAGAACESDLIKAALEREDINSKPVGLRISGNFAACCISHLGKKALCVFEKSDGVWKLVICNPDALKQNLDFPKINFNNEYFITWEYPLRGHSFTFSARRGEDEWGPVSQTALLNNNNYKELYNLSWKYTNNSKIVCNHSIMYDNLTLIAEDNCFLPAFWLKESSRLADFDIERFPAIGVHEDALTDSIFTGRYIKESCEQLVPDSVYRGGFFKNGDMHYFVQMRSGEKYYVVVDCSNKDTTPVIKSALLPQDAQFGVANYTESISVEGLAVSVSSAGSNFCLDYIETGGDYENNAIIYPHGVLQGGYIDFIYYGNHPWSDVSKIDWSSLPKSWRDAVRQVNSRGFAKVNNPDHRDRLHLREKPDKSSRSKGKYYNGTPVTVLEVKGEWTHVSIGNTKGWMMTQYLYFPKEGEVLLCNMAETPQLAMDKPAIKVYDQPKLTENFFTPYTMYTYDPTLKIIGVVGDDWYHVWFPKDDFYGYILQNSVSPGNG